MAGNRKGETHPYKNKMLTMKQISELPRAKRAGLSYPTLNSRINRSKLTVEEALSKPIGTSKKSKPSPEWHKYSDNDKSPSFVNQMLASI